MTTNKDYLPSSPDKNYIFRYKGDSCLIEMQGGNEVDALLEADAINLVAVQNRYTEV